CTAVPSATTGGPVELRTISSGAYAAARPEAPQAVAASDEAAYRRLWPATIGGGEPPAVDFATESVVFLLAGAKPTGGWSVVPRGAKVEGDTLVIDASIQGPAPYAVITVKTKAFTDVRWNP